MKLTLTTFLLLPAAVSSSFDHEWFCSVFPLDPLICPPVVPPLTASCTPNANPTTANSTYTISGRYSTATTGSLQLQTAFNAAKERVRRFIIGDVSNQESVSIPESDKCGASTNATIDDISVCIHSESFDGVGGLLAFARPLFFRTEGDIGLPYYGQITIDTLDLNDPRLSNIMLSGLMTVIGFGSIWTAQGLKDNADDCTYKVASEATNEYRCISNCENTPPPIGSGISMSNVKCQSWSEACMPTELMSATLGTEPQSISRVTVASFQDLGYLVNYNGADTYTYKDVPAACKCVGSRRLREGRGFAKAPEEYARKLSEAQQAARDRAIKAGKEHLHRARKLAADNVETESSQYMGDNSVVVFYDEPESGNAIAVTVNAED